jgi:hypothetical protein
LHRAVRSERLGTERASVALTTLAVTVASVTSATAVGAPIERAAPGRGRPLYEDLLRGDLVGVAVAEPSVEALEELL